MKVHSSSNQGFAGTLHIKYKFPKGDISDIEHVSSRSINISETAESYSMITTSTKGKKEFAFFQITDDAFGVKDNGEPNKIEDFSNITIKSLKSLEKGFLKAKKGANSVARAFVEHLNG